jgi:hypothetical protein
MSTVRWVWLASLLLAGCAAAYVSWVPPHAALVQAHPVNATHFTAYVNNTAVYIVQAGLSFRGSSAEARAVTQYLSTQCRYVAVDVHEVLKTARGALWLADVYCSRDGSMWLWLRWLPLRFTAYSGQVEFVNATDVTAATPIDTFTNYIPAGWYLDPSTKAVFKVPGANLTLLSYAASLSEQLKALKAELNKSRSDASQLAARLEAQLAGLEAQRRALEEALRQRESEVTALQANLRAAQAESERLRSQLAELKAENDRLRSQLASANQTIARLNNQLTSLKAQLAAQTSGGEEGIDPLVFVLVAALAGVAAAFVIYRKKKAEE